jgi:hypothetical protein
MGFKLPISKLKRIVINIKMIVLLFLIALSLSAIPAKNTLDLMIVNGYTNEKIDVSNHLALCTKNKKCYAFSNVTSISALSSETVGNIDISAGVNKACVDLSMNGRIIVSTLCINYGAIDAKSWSIIETTNAMIRATYTIGSVPSDVRILGIYQGDVRTMVIMLEHI